MPFHDPTPQTLATAGRVMESLYLRFARREYLASDPVEFLHAWDDPADREIVGLLTAGLAYGRVAQIRKSVAGALQRLGDRPARTVFDESPRQLRRRYSGFRHRVTAGRKLAELLIGAGRVCRQFGSLREGFMQGLSPGDRTVLPAAGQWVRKIDPDRRCLHLLPDPSRGSACKRLHLYFRWMVRRDLIDPGGWRGVCPSLLVVPLDTHMHRIGRSLGMTDRRSADEKTALEITRCLRRLHPHDPIRYDFPLTRIGICPEMDLSQLVARLGLGKADVIV